MQVGYLPISYTITARYHPTGDCSLYVNYDHTRPRASGSLCKRCKIVSLPSYSECILTFLPGSVFSLTLHIYVILDCVPISGLPERKH